MCNLDQIHFQCRRAYCANAIRTSEEPQVTERCRKAYRKQLEPCQCPRLTYGDKIAKDSELCWSCEQEWNKQAGIYVVEEILEEKRFQEEILGERPFEERMGEEILEEGLAEEKTLLQKSSRLEEEDWPAYVAMWDRVLGKVNTKILRRTSCRTQRAADSGIMLLFSCMLSWISRYITIGGDQRTMSPEIVACDIHTCVRL